MTAIGERAASSGEWVGVFGNEVGVLLPRSLRDRAAALWPLLDGGARVEQVLDALLRDGLSELDDLVLVSTAEARVRVLLRGSARVELWFSDRSLQVEQGDRVWADETHHDVRGIEVVLDPHGARRAGHPSTLHGGLDAAQFDVRPGLVRVGRVSWGTPGPAEPSLTAVPRLRDDEPTPPRPTPAIEERPVIRPVVRAVPDVETAPLVASPPHAPRAPQAPAAPPAPPAAPEPPAESGDDPWGEDATTLLPPTGPIDLPPGQRRTTAYEDDQPTDIVPFPRGSNPGIARLAFSHGLAVEVDGPIVVGRAPEVPAGRTEHVELITVPSPLGEISATHVEIRPGTGVDEGTAVAVDLGSTNGTVVVQPGLGPQTLRVGVPVSLLPGAVVDLGDGATIRVAPV